MAEFGEQARVGGSTAPCVCVTVNAPLRLLGIGHRPVPTDKDDRRSERVRRFVPHTAVHSHADHHIDSDNVADLINMERRFYLRPVDENARACQATLMDASMDDNASNDSDLAFFNDFNDAASAKQSSVLDLGTVTLQRIVTQMKGLHYEDSPQHDSYVKDAAKLSGLKSYGDYILGVVAEDTYPHFA